MKRIGLALLTILLVAAVMILPVFATTGGAAAGEVTGVVGTEVSVDISVSGYPEVESMGIRYTLPEGLSLVKAEWLLAGIISDVALDKNQGVWAHTSPVDLTSETPVFRFTFMVLEPEAGQTDLVEEIPVEVILNEDGDWIPVTGKVTVSNPATAVSLNKTGLSLDPCTGGATLTATVLPATTTDKVVWSSSDEKVVTVSGGVVTVVGEGTATVKATAGKKSASCTVTVAHDYKDGYEKNENGHWNACKNGTHTTEVEAHDYEWVTDTPATDVENGVKHQECKLCGYVTAEGTVIEHTHKVTEHKAVAATCKKEGSKLHYTCASTHCAGKYYADKACTQLLTSVVESVNPNNHVNQKLEGKKDATCYQAGYTGDTVCGDCGKTVKAGTTVAATGNHVAGTKWYSDGTNHWHLCTTSGCNAKVGTAAHNYDAGTVTKQPTCVASGVLTLRCKSCGHEKERTISATGNHVAGAKWYSDGTSHWHLCTTSGCSAKVDTAKHSFKWVVDKAATEYATGLKHEACVCGAQRSQGTVIPKLDHVHKGIEYHDAASATCVKAGTVEYWTCASDLCEGKYYGDADCQLELESIVAPINPANHTGKTELKGEVTVTCTTDGYTGDTYCADCQKLLTKGETVTALGHDLYWVIDQYPSEEAEGRKHQVCNSCGYLCDENTVIEKLEHIPTLVAGKEPTCDEAGVEEHYYCTSCGKYYASAAGTVGEEITGDTVTLEPLGHSYGTEWISDESGHWHGCDCGDKADLAEHTPEIVGAEEPAVGKPGYTGDTVCSVCGYQIAEGETIPAETTVPPTTQAPTTQAPTTRPGGQDDQPGQPTGIGVILAVLLGVAAVAAIVILLLLKKRKEQEEA